MDACQRHRQALAEALAEDRDPTTSAEFQAHERACSDCRQARSDLAEGLDRIAASASLAVPLELTEAVMRRVRRAPLPTASQPEVSPSPGTVRSPLERLRDWLGAGDWGLAPYASLALATAAVCLGLVFLPGRPDPSPGELARVPPTEEPIPAEPTVRGEEPARGTEDSPETTSPTAIRGPEGFLAVGESLTHWASLPGEIRVGTRTRVQLETGSSVRALPEGLFLLAGRARFEVTPGAERVEVSCPAGKVVVVGTRFALEVSRSGRTALTVEEGRVEFQGIDGETLLVTPEIGSVVADPGQTPRPVETAASPSQEETRPARLADTTGGATLEDPFHE